MSGRRARFTMKEVVTLIKAAQKEHARVVIELDEAGKFRVVVNETAGIDQAEDMVF
jgi:hypothetical protein